MTREISAEAAVWIARLHGPDRSHHMERDCRAWQARSAAHRLAFERGTDLWMEAAGVDRAAVARAATASGPEGRGEEGQGASPANAGTRGRAWPRPWALALTATAAVLVVGVLVAQPWRSIDSYDTGIGEQRLVILKDGTRMSLNTSTRVKVELDQTERRVRVEGGEAFFEVAKDVSRPFVVQAADAAVTATGTAFLVRIVPSNAGVSEALDITLVEGQVIVQGSGSGKAAPAIAQSVVMAAGERLRVRSDQGGHRSPQPAAAPALDRPRMDQLLAWRRGEAVFADLSLLEAVTEMNRYSATPIVLAAGLSDLRVSGQYKTGDSEGFARAVAKLHGLAVLEHAGRLELAPEWARNFELAGGGASIPLQTQHCEAVKQDCQLDKRLGALPERYRCNPGLVERLPTKSTHPDRSSGSPDRRTQ
ncbi:FecR family protein [Paucibacter sp. M5-1]|uniref:FecR family protein n=1 Tax=Paucibacter sp. M5-1 TaxID=3015998 RepID=UPI0022B92F65|nr:FecR domain-containing protein [Paucibacter sp. M5-1]MCZ7884091.1 FecR domain-containing protein [Paucibacter sp. M5-1]